MKKSFAKLTAITLASTTLVAVAPIQAAEAVDFPAFSDHEYTEDEYTEDESVEDESEKETEEADVSAGFKTLADAVAAADAHLENDPLNNGFKIEQSADGLYYVQLTMDGTKVLPAEKIEEIEETEEDVDFSAGFKTLADAVAAADAQLENDPINNGYKIEKGADDLYYVQLTIEDTKVVPEEETEEDVDFTVGFKTLADAVAAADAHLENDPINNGYKIEKGADDLYYVQLTIEDTKVVPEVEAEEEFVSGPYDTFEEAQAHAEEIIAKSKINNGYNISQGADGKWYIQLTIEEGKTKGQERTPIVEEPDDETEVETDVETKEKVTVKKSEEKLPETGESSSYAIFGAAALAVLAGVGLVAPSFKKEN